MMYLLLGKMFFFPLLCQKINGRNLPVLLLYFFKSMCNMEPKLSDTYVFSWNECNFPFLTVIKNDAIVRRGPKFLQRYFIRTKVGDRVVILPWRVTEIYYAKSAVRISGMDDPPIYLAILRGLMLDTCGTNIKAFEYLRFLEGTHLAKFPDANAKLKALIMTGGAFKHADWFTKIYRMGITDPTFLCTSLSRTQILRKFFPFIDYSLYQSRRWN